MGVAFTGDEAEVRWVYHRAARLRAWTITVEADRIHLTATVAESDADRVSQHPLAFVVPRTQGRPWRWPIRTDTLQIAGGTLTASLGPQE